MSFSIDGRNLPALTSFAACERHFKRRLTELTTRRKNSGTWSETVLPIRDDSGAWKDTSKRLEKDGDSYACVYHHTPVVKYFADGRVEFEAGWDSVSTGIFFNAFAPGRWTFTRERGYRFYCNGSEYHTCTRADPLRLDANGVVTNGVSFKYFKRLADMPRRREIREKLKPFYEWFKTMTKVTNSVAAVVNVDNMPLDRNGRLWASVATFQQAAVALLAPEAEEGDWRFACTCARAMVGGSSFWNTFAIQPFEEKFGIQYAEPMLRVIEGVLWRQCGGWKEVEVVVAPGEKP